MENNNYPIELSIVMPCLNEEQTLGICIQKALHYIETHHINAEIIIADNGSCDESINIATSLGATVVHIISRGYGNALKGGIDAAIGKYIIMGDADDSYDFSALDGFIKRLRAGDDLVMGNRFLGGIRPNAMPALHRYLGNPVLSFIGRVFFSSSIGDFHCGLRGFSKQSYELMNLKSDGMEFASEIVIEATLLGLKTSEVPTVLYPDGRNRAPHLQSWSDGWRHLKLLLLYCPRWLFLYPAIFFILLALGSMGKVIFHRTESIQQMPFNLWATLITIAAFLFHFYLLGRLYAAKSGYHPLRLIHKMIINLYTIERGIYVGGGLILLSSVYMIMTIFDSTTIKNLSTHIATFVCILGLFNGVLILMNSFMIRILHLK